jgi:hypothetical protein
VTRQAKRLAAALAAVEQYLEQEQAQPAVVVRPAPAPSAWLAANRIEQMSLRAAMQAKGRR